MRFKEFKENGRIITDSKEINKILAQNHLQWLINSEIEEAQIEIINNTIIWYNGHFNAGTWHYGIWKNGIFNSIWENGIWENGTFNGIWKSGIKSLNKK